MNTSDLKQFKARMDNDATSITEADIASTHEALSNVPSEGFALLFSVFSSMFAAIGLVLFFDLIAFSFEGLKELLGLSLLSLSFCITHRRISWHGLVNDVSFGLNVLSSTDPDACQKVLDLSEAVPAARKIRSDLLAANRPIRAMHLRAMQKLDTDNLAAKVAAQRDADAKAAVCRAAHGIPA